MKETLCAFDPPCVCLGQGLGFNWEPLELNHGRVRFESQERDCFPSKDVFPVHLVTMGVCVHRKRDSESVGSY